jgi:hypothetical protein
VEDLAEQAKTGDKEALVVIVRVIDAGLQYGGGWGKIVMEVRVEDREP